MRYEPVIGLEIHVQLATKSKMFCACPIPGEEAAPNTSVCPVCMGHPGTLPVANAQAVRLGIKVGLALGCTIPDQAKFDRKHYFYPDLPKGYQISQYDEPICRDGKLTIDFPASAGRAAAEIRIERAHLEEDAAKNVHAGDRTGVEAADATLVDYNRAGTPLLETVTAPDLRSPAEAKTFLQEFRAILRTLAVSDADMERGHMRCDANISLRRVNDDGSIIDLTFNPKTEIKNLNSFRAVERALEYEIQRQTKLFEEGTPPMGGETRGWNDGKGVTEPQRTKEGEADYRYFPEPDLPPLLLADMVKQEGGLPELPAAKRRRFMDEYGFAAADARQMAAEPDLANYVEQVASELGDWLSSLPEVEGTATDIWKNQKDKLAKLISGWVLSKLGGLMAERNVAWGDLKISPEDFAEFLSLIWTQKVNSTAAQVILAEMLETGKDPSHIMEDRGLGQISEPEELRPVVRDILAKNPDVAAQYRAGKTQVLKSLVGMAMKVTEGRAHPQTTEKLFTEELAG
ncbi:MAG: Asp-tRNA(Asn)/Glu-tRNA(Gln) amidotransferase subunit GatB [Patescibacteria group bacterium]